MISQVSYRFKYRPTLKDVERNRRAFIAGRPTDATVDAIAWTSEPVSQEEIRRHLRKGKHGAAGIVKLYGRPDQTLHDVDEDRHLALRVIARFCWHTWKMSVKPVWVREDRTARGWHMIVRWNRSFTPLEIIALQAVFGSDRQREAYNLTRYFSGLTANRRWNLLFEFKL